MITFLLYTALALLANGCLARIIFTSIQPGQWLDILLNWQNRLQQWDRQGKAFLVKAGGYCELCFSHAITFLCYWGYAFTMQLAIGEWITSSVTNTGATVIINIVWYLVYVSIGTNLSLHFISKLHKKE
jgi:hypothetical protein